MAGDEEKTAAERTGSMNRMARGLFAPAYPAIALRIVDVCDIIDGRCIDVGSGSGMLGISLAKITYFMVDLMDMSAENRKYAERNLRKAGLKRRCRFVTGDIGNMPFDDDYADLIISRGSIFFWENLDAAFKEILRVLKPGGKTFIGGGFGKAEVRDAICSEMAKDDPEWDKDNEVGKKKTVEHRLRILRALEEGEFCYRAYSDDSGFWIVLMKEHN